MFQKKEQGKILKKKNCNETEINNPPDKEFKAIVITMVTELGKEQMKTVRFLTKN